MTDVVAGQIITGIVTITGFVFQYLMGKKRTQRAKVDQEEAVEKVVAKLDTVRTISEAKADQEAVLNAVQEVHAMVNGHSTKQDEKIDVLHAKVEALLKEKKK